jgi:hypothetical protein
MRVNRPKLNLIVDLVAFVCAVFLIVTGFLLEYTLPPGKWPPRDGRLWSRAWWIAKAYPPVVGFDATRMGQLSLLDGHRVDGRLISPSSAPLAVDCLHGYGEAQGRVRHSPRSRDARARFAAGSRVSPFPEPDSSDAARSPARATSTECSPQVESTFGNTEASPSGE